MNKKDNFKEAFKEEMTFANEAMELSKCFYEKIFNFKVNPKDIKDGVINGLKQMAAIMFLTRRILEPMMEPCSKENPNFAIKLSALDDLVVEVITFFTANAKNINSKTTEQLESMGQT